MKNITDIFFDLDHTLWDFDKNSALAFDKIFQKHHPSLAVDRFVEIYEPVNQACWKLYQVDEITHEELRYRRLRQTFDILGYSVSDEEIDRISYDYIEFLPENNRLFEGTLEILDYLVSKYNLHIITNGLAEVQYKKLQNSGISRYFKTVTNSEMAGAKKPSRQIFEFALSLAKVEKEQAVMIGDSMDADVKGALDCGMSAVWFDEKKTSPLEDVLTINYLVELKKIL